jgi:hypothetical protein
VPALNNNKLAPDQVKTLTSAGIRLQGSKIPDWSAAHHSSTHALHKSPVRVAMAANSLFFIYHPSHAQAVARRSSCRRRRISVRGARSQLQGAASGKCNISTSWKTPTNDSGKRMSSLGFSWRTSRRRKNARHPRTRHPAFSRNALPTCIGGGCIHREPPDVDQRTLLCAPMCLALFIFHAFNGTRTDLTTQWIIEKASKLF